MKSRNGINAGGALRLGVAAAMFALGLGISWALRGDSGGDDDSGTGKRKTEERDLRKWAEEQRAAMARETKLEAMMRRVVESREAGLAVQIVDLMRLVRDTPPERLGEFLEQTHRELYETYLGEVVCEAIFERMKVEAPEDLIERGVSGRSKFLADQTAEIVTLGIEREGIEEFLKRLDEGGDHRTKVTMMLEAISKRPLGEGLKLVADLDENLRKEIEPRVIESMARQGSVEGLEAYLSSPSTRLDMRELTSGFSNLASKDVDAALSLLTKIPGSVSKEILLGHVAQSWVDKDKVAAFTYADKIESPVLKSHFIAGMLEAYELKNEDERTGLIEKIPLKNWRSRLSPQQDRVRLTNPFDIDE